MYTRSSSVSIVSGYGLEDRAIEVRFPAEIKDFSSSHCVQTGSGAHPASCPGCKSRPGRDADHSPPLVLRSWMSRSYTSSPSNASKACSGLLFFTINVHTTSTAIYISMFSKASTFSFFISMCKAVALHAMEALGGERRYSSYSFTTSALDGVEWSASRPGRALPPGKGPPVPIVQEAGWAPEPVWAQRLEEKSSAPTGDRTPIARSSSPQSDTILPELPGSPRVFP
jgi:hypothetical protein